MGVKMSKDFLKGFAVGALVVGIGLGIACGRLWHQYKEFETVAYDNKKIAKDWRAQYITAISRYEFLKILTNPKYENEDNSLQQAEKYAKDKANSIKNILESQNSLYPEEKEAVARYKDKLLNCKDNCLLVDREISKDPSVSLPARLHAYALACFQGNGEACSLGGVAALEDQRAALIGFALNKFSCDTGGSRSGGACVTSAFNYRPSSNNITHSLVNRDLYLRSLTMACDIVRYPSGNEDASAACAYLATEYVSGELVPRDLVRAKQLRQKSCSLAPYSIPGSLACEQLKNM